ncbi:Lrp/AsnC family transcriptional regulator [Altererythrobacter lutimaris]|uniref:Lrp/AsnC family transcriptional regulator n=1 Tax=Altererythrobacter lutimaris TaxID=2743979 RepID=A0A850HEH8_9SPHN|nr:Lrp/AsnC family transcriptional regulator [Altererythrobacter lutimaris]NVE95561.1 Lrp/AsnC family transcriptional regulator [Altererythrobacter lutimaris]
MRSNFELDDRDWAILALLQRNASLSVQDIADQVGLSANPCWRRIKQMEEAGVIARRVAIVDPAKIGFASTAFVAIRTNRHDPEWLALFANAISEIDQVMECHRMAGDVDYMLKVRVRDIADYDQVYRKLIARVPGLIDVTTTFSMEEMKASTALPRPS